MDENRKLIFGQTYLTQFCPVCGLPLMLDGCCRKYHKVKGLKRDKELHGRSKSPNRFNNA